MRWDNLTTTDQDNVALPLFPLDGVTRTFDTPEFAGMTFHEVRAKSIINRVPSSSRMPFSWTINPYRGCSHACRYCFARNTHSYLDFDTGRDFDTQIVVKVNAVELLRRELAAPSWQGEHIAMGTNVDCYQRAEGRYQLMPGIISALRDRQNPFSILTKGSLILRDLDLLTSAAAVTDVSVNVSIGFVDQKKWRSVEPGTPSPQARLKVCQALSDAGISCGVLMAPILPYLTDSPEQLEATVAAIADSGARFAMPIVLHLRPGVRDWYFSWLAQEHPDLVSRYHELYKSGAYADSTFQRDIAGLVRQLTDKYGLTRQNSASTRVARPKSQATSEQSTREKPTATQLSLL